MSWRAGADCQATLKFPQNRSGAPGRALPVVVHVDAEVLADPDAPGQSVLEDGARVPPGTSQRLACDASRVVMRHDRDGRVVEVVSTRTPRPRVAGGAPGRRLAIDVLHPLAG